MLKLFKSLANKTLFENWLIKIRWPFGRITCPRCPSQRVGFTKHKTMPYWCTDCREYFSLKTNTLMEGSSISLYNWGKAVYYVIEKITEVKTTKLSKDLNITQSTAWKLLFRIHEVFDNEKCPEEFEYSQYFHVDLRPLRVRSNSIDLEKSNDLFAICITELGSLKIWANAIPVVNTTTIADIVNAIIPKNATVFMDTQYQKMLTNNKSFTLKDYNGSIAEMLSQAKGLREKSNKTVEQKWEILNHELEKIANSSERKDRRRKLKIFAGRWNLQFHDIEERMKIVFTAICDKKFAK